MDDWNFFFHLLKKKKICTPPPPLYILVKKKNEIRGGGNPTSRLAVFSPNRPTGNDFLLKGGLTTTFKHVWPEVYPHRQRDVRGTEHDQIAFDWHVPPSFGYKIFTF